MCECRCSIFVLGSWGNSQWFCIQVAKKLSCSVVGFFCFHLPNSAQPFDFKVSGDHGTQSLLLFKRILKLCYSGNSFSQQIHFTENQAYLSFRRRQLTHRVRQSEHYLNALNASFFASTAQNLIFCCLQAGIFAPRTSYLCFQSRLHTRAFMKIYSFAVYQVDFLKIRFCFLPHI